jgi:hypothetical protein
MPPPPDLTVPDYAPAAPGDGGGKGGGTFDVENLDVAGTVQLTVCGKRMSSGALRQLVIGGWAEPRCHTLVLGHTCSRTGSQRSVACARRMVAILLVVVVVVALRPPDPPGACLCVSRTLPLPPSLPLSANAKVVVQSLSQTALPTQCRQAHSRRCQQAAQTRRRPRRRPRPRGRRRRRPRGRRRRRPRPRQLLLPPRSIRGHAIDVRVDFTANVLRSAGGSARLTTRVPATKAIGAATVTTFCAHGVLLPCPRPGTNAWPTRRGGWTPLGTAATTTLQIAGAARLWNRTARESMPSMATTQTALAAQAARVAGLAPVRYPRPPTTQRRCCLF